ncbi:MAG: aminopeptidase [Eubacteriales bacterium]|jgi:aspartyl aminopeptidase|nr:aminopeptidase [Clostridiales bacterium]MDY5732775.1 aminopeptidase [Eubacteriales bacterium]
MERKNAWKTYDEAQLTALNTLCADYKAFLDKGKTERECVVEAVKQARAHGYFDLEDAMKQGRTLKAGDKVYHVCMDKTIALYHIGKAPIENGMNILGAHIDSPRIDIKQNPLYEDNDFAMLDTHYYGGIKKYQWVTLPLAMHGVIVKKDGTIVNVVIGEDDNDPVLGISDLLVHLSQEQMQKTAAKVIDGEDLNIIIGSMPLKDEEKEAVKANAMKLIADRYGIDEEDFLSAELEIVPAGKARDFGLDRSMIIAYGQDDRVCAYTSLAAMLELDGEIEKTCCCLLVDKEEIGSVGATGMSSMFFENSVAELMNLMGDYSELKLRRALRNCKMLSSDVSAAFDPTYASAFEKKNSAFFGRGVVFNKFTGSRGKSGSNDANAEFVAEVRRVMDDSGVMFQTAELGRVDLGGGGTIAYISAKYGMQVIDSGVAVLSMHAPWEITSKADVYEAKKCYAAFLMNK